MQVHEKIRLLRQLKGWSQEELAHRLEMSVSGYGGIERGEIDISLSRLEQIAKVFEVNLAELFLLSEKSVFYAGNSNTLTNSSQINSLSPDSINLQLEKNRLEIEYLRQQIIDLKQQNTDLREINQLLKENKMV